MLRFLRASAFCEGDDAEWLWKGLRCARVLFLRENAHGYSEV